MSLKGGISHTELLNTIDDAKKGKQEAIEKLAKYVDDGKLSREEFEPLITHCRINKKKKDKTQKALFVISLLLIISLTCIFKVFAHSGRTDANGGHWDRSTGTYHYHTGEYAGQSSSSSSENEKPQSFAEYTRQKKGITGYDEGYEKGHTDGYYEGYDKGFADGYDKQTVTLGIATLSFIFAIIVFVKLVKRRRKE